MKKLLLPLLILFVACGDSSRDDDNVLARAYNEYLYLSEIEGIVPVGTNVSDSIAIIKNFVNNWVSEQLFLNKAEKNLLPGDKDFKTQLDEYRNSLIIYKYESKLVLQNLDTLVTDREIEEYYNENQGNFQLKNNIVRAFYARFDENFEDLDIVRRFFYSDRPEFRDSLDLYIENYSDLYLLNDETWILFSDVLRFVPINTYNEQSFLESQRKIEIAEEPNIYFVNITDYRIKEGLSPLNFERENIRKIILNKRKLAIIQDMREEVFNTALERNDFEIY